MTDREPVEVTNLDRYGNPALSWNRVESEFAEWLPDPGVTTFLGTVSAEGRPHAAGIGAMWLDGILYFTSSPAARKARDLAANPACTMSMRLKGVDVVVAGEASRVTDQDTLTRVAARYSERGWPAVVEGDAFTAPFNAPSAGPPPWHLYRFQFDTVYGVAVAEPYGATRWRFADHQR